MAQSTTNVQISDSFKNEAELSSRISGVCTHSVNTMASIQDCILSEHIYAGQRLNGKMSRVRRFFCLFVTFDLLLIALIWLISIMLTGGNLKTALKDQIFHYTIYKSMFDVVLISISRFVFLLLFYGIVYINHWIIISLTTTGTCSFLVAKVVEYSWAGSSQQICEIMLILSSFVLSWGEVWFLDVKVLPQEYLARCFLSGNSTQDRAPLVENYVNSLPSAPYCESVGAFHSVRNSPEPSISEFPICDSTQISPSAYQQISENTFKEAWNLLNVADWKIKQKTDSDIVYGLKRNNTNIFKLSTKVNASPCFIRAELFDNVNTLSEWSSVILESYKMQEIDNTTDIIYQVSASGAGGIVSSRDFVILRHWRCVNGIYIIACVSIEHPEKPYNEKYVRGFNGPSCWVIQPFESDSRKCHLHWMLNTNLKLNTFIPQKVQEKAFIGSMLDFMRQFKLHVNLLQEDTFSV